MKEKIGSGLAVFFFGYLGATVGFLLLLLVFALLKLHNFNNIVMLLMIGYFGGAGALCSWLQRWSRDG